MPIKSRHSIIGIGAIASAAQSASVDLSNGAKGILYITTDGACNVQAQASPDGTTWFDYLSPIAFAGAGSASAQYGTLPMHFRLSNDATGGAVTASYVEAIREIA